LPSSSDAPSLNQPELTTAVPREPSALFVLLPETTNHALPVENWLSPEKSLVKLDQTSVLLLPLLTAWQHSKELTSLNVLFAIADSPFNLTTLV